MGTYFLINYSGRMLGPVVNVSSIELGEHHSSLLGFCAKPPSIYIGVDVVNVICRFDGVRKQDAAF